MTNPGRCPHCNGTFYTPDPDPGGAGRNKCLTCQRASPVREFYEQRPCTCHPDDKPPVPCAQKYALSECRPSTLKTDKPAAPIRQYKDD